MRFSPQMRDLNWLVARPITHRGLHSGTAIENCEAAFSAALINNYAIECDLQLTADGEAIVFHDDNVDRVLHAEGAVKSFSTKQLKKLKFKNGTDRIQTLAELLEQVAGAQTLVIELKSHWDNDQTLTHRALDVLQNYGGPHALMSFDPTIVACIAEQSPTTVRGITADRVTDPSYNQLSIERRLEMRSFSHLAKTRPHFVSFDFKALPFGPVSEIREAGHPIISWAIDSEAEAKMARRYSDQITFQYFAAK